MTYIIKIDHCGFDAFQSDIILFYLMNAEKKKHICLPGLLIIDLKLKPIASHLIQMLLSNLNMIVCIVIISLQI